MSNRPKIVCLCGSTRFWKEFQRQSLVETVAGKIVLSIGAASGTDEEHFGNLPEEEYDELKERLDELHLRKIDLADEVLILNVDGYVGESTRREALYAIRQGKVVRWLEPFKVPADLLKVIGENMEAQLMGVAQIGMELSTMAAAIHWDGSRNTQDWLRGLKGLIVAFQGATVPLLESLGELEEIALIDLKGGHFLHEEDR